MKTAFVAFVLAVAAASQAVEITASLQSSVQVDDGIFAYADEDGSPSGALALDTIEAGKLYSETANVEGDITQYLSYRYTLIGTYGGGAGIVLGLNPEAAANAIGTEFSTLFPGVNEASLVSSVQSSHRVLNGSGSFADLLNLGTAKNFLENNRSMFAQGLTGGSLVAFSTGQDVGTLVATPTAVPEPASMIALGAGAAALMRRRRRS